MDLRCEPLNTAKEETAPVNGDVSQEDKGTE